MDGETSILVQNIRKINEDHLETLKNFREKFQCRKKIERGTRMVRLKRNNYYSSDPYAKWCRTYDRNILVSSCGLKKNIHFYNRVLLHEAPTKNGFHCSEKKH